MRNLLFGLLILVGIIMIWAPVVVLGATMEALVPIIAVQVLGGIVVVIGVWLLFFRGD